jgi:hypothetical protein
VLLRKGFWGFDRRGGLSMLFGIVIWVILRIERRRGDESRLMSFGFGDISHAIG